MQLNRKERVMLANQYKILAALDPDSSSRYIELMEIVENGYEIFYSMIDEWYRDEMSKEEGQFVLDILDLYRAIEDVKRRTKDSDLISHPSSVFRGFDGNNETAEMAFCRFLIDRQGKFEEQKRNASRNGSFNSHTPMKEKYRRMLEAADSVDIWTMDSQEALQIINS